MLHVGGLQRHAAQMSSKYPLNPMADSLRPAGPKGRTFHMGLGMMARQYTGLNLQPPFVFTEMS